MAGVPGGGSLMPGLVGTYFYAPAWSICLGRVLFSVFPFRKPRDSFFFLLIFRFHCNVLDALSAPDAVFP